MTSVEESVLVLGASLVVMLISLAIFDKGSTFGHADASLTVPSVSDSNLRIETVITGLSSPTSMAFIGPNDILVLEKNTGMVKRVKDNRILPQPLLDVKVANNSERGLLGIDVLKISASQFYVFLYYTQSLEDGGAPIKNRLYRYLLTIGSNLGPAQGTMTSPKLLLNLPVLPGPNHDGGKVTVARSGNVYTVLGDLNRQGEAQNFENGASPDGTGGILRVTLDGNTVGSGFLGNTHPINKYVAYGIRNSFGMDFDPLTGYLWDTENGPGASDEINRVFGGFNSGWRDIMGMAPAGFNFDNLENFGGRGTYSPPEFVWTQVVAPTSIEFLTSSSLGASYQNDMFVGDFNNGRIYNFNLNSQRTALLLGGPLVDRVANSDSETQSVVFGQGFNGVTDLKTGAGDGLLYVLSIGNGAIYRIVPAATLTTMSDRVQQFPSAAETSSDLQLNPEDDTIDRSSHVSDERGDDSLCERMSDRLEQIEEQENRDILREEDAKELSNRIEEVRENMDCR